MQYLNITLRITSIMGLLLFLILITGRRKISELPVFDFLAIIIIGSVVGADIADPEIPHLPTAYALVLIIAIQFTVSYLTVRSRKFGSKVTFAPTVVIQNGHFVKSNMKKIRYSVENILMYLREKDVFDLREVEFAVVEDSGNISVMKKAHFQPLTPSDMSISTRNKGLSIPLVIDGEIQDSNMKKLNLEKEWLINRLKDNGIENLENAFYVDIGSEGKLHISKDLEQDKTPRDFKI